MATYTHFLRKRLARVRAAAGAGGVALALAATPASAGDARLLAQAYADQARYLATEAVSYEHGEGVPRDQAYAARLYCESARLGDAEGMYALGWMYANGRGVERNDGYANTLFSMAAALGNEHASRMLRYTGEYTGDAPECLRTPEHIQRQNRPIDALVARPSPARSSTRRRAARRRTSSSCSPTARRSTCPRSSTTTG